MAERIDKLILETEYKVTGTETSVQRLTALQEATKKVAAATIEKVAADKRVEQSANQLNKAVETETLKQSALAKSLDETGKAMNTIAQTNSLKEAFTDTGIKDVSAQLAEFVQVARSAETLDELSKAMDDFVASLPEDIQTEVFVLLQKETAELAKQLENPLIRLRELRRLANTETDPALFKVYAAEAAKLQNELEKNQKLITALASESFFADTVIEGAQQAVGAFAAFQGVLALTTVDQEKFAEAAAKAQGALALLQGVQSVVTNLKKADNIVTRLQIVGQRAYAAVIGQSTGALKAFRLAFAAIGIGLIVAGIALLVANWDKLTGGVKSANAELERNNKVIGRDNSNLTKRLALLENSNAPIAFQVELQKKILQNDVSILKNEVAISRNKKDSEGTEGKINELKTKQLELAKLVANEESRRRDLVDDARRITDDEYRKEAEARDAAKQFSDEILVIDERKLAIRLEFEKAGKRIAELEKIANSNPVNPVFPDQPAVLSLDLNQRDEFDALKKSREELKKEFRGIIQDRIALKGAVDQIQLGDDVFAEGSLDALENQVAKLKEIVSSLGEGTERDKALNNLRKAENALTSLRQSLFETQNVDLFLEEERHQLAMQSINEDSEEEKLNTQIKFAKLRLIELEGSGVASKDELEKQRNAISELEATLPKVVSADNKARNDALKQEEERHQIAMQTIAGDSEINKLKTQLVFAKERFNELVNSGTAKEDELKRQGNAIIELEASINDIVGVADKANNEAIFNEEERHQLAMQSILGDSEKNKLKTQLSYAKDRLSELKKSGTATASEIQKQANIVAEIEANLTQETTDEAKTRKELIIEEIRKVVNAAISLADSLFQIEIDKYDRLTQLQQERVNEATGIADKGNVALLDLEEKRLADLNSKREKFVRRQQQLAQAQIIVESMLAIAKTAGDTGAAAPVTIALTLIALAAGLAQARAAAQSQSFREGGIYEGGYTGQGAPGGVSHNLGNKPYDYHYQEHIMPHPVVKIGSNLQWLERIRKDRIDIGKMLGRKSQVVVVEGKSNNNSGTQVINNFNLNSKGIISIVKSEDNNRKRIDSKR